MGLADRIQHPDSGSWDFTDGMIAIHAWTAAFELYCYGEATRAQLIAVFALDVTEQAGLDQLKAAYDALSTALEKHVFLHKLEAAGRFYQYGKIDKTKYKQILGLV